MGASGSARKLFRGCNGVERGPSSVDTFSTPCQRTEQGRPNRLPLSAALHLTSYSEKPLIASPTNLTPNTRKRTARMAALF